MAYYINILDTESHIFTKTSVDFLYLTFVSLCIVFCREKHRSKYVYSSTFIKTRLKHVFYA